LVSLKPDIIVTTNTPTTVAVQKATQTIPIVFAAVGDPVATGIVPRLDRPSGNITGFAVFEAPLGGKWLELLSEIAPGLKRAAIMFNPDTPALTSIYMPSLDMAARSLKVELITAPVRDDVEIETTIIALGSEPGGGLVVMPDLFTNLHRASITLAAARNNVPAVYWSSSFARVGGLLSYGVDVVDSFRRAATYVDRILGGAKPADLPVQFPTKFLAVNLKTANRPYCAAIDIATRRRGDRIAVEANQDSLGCCAAQAMSGAGITAPGILRLVVTLREKKRKNSSSARRYDQIRSRFHTAWVIRYRSI
jgi:putative ABC transport system substrate-binding protein